MGLSVLANQIDKFKSIDTKYDSFDREFVTGKRRVIIPKSMIKADITGVDEKGNPIRVYYFDTNDEVYVSVNGLDSKDIKDINFELRTDEHITAINSELNYLSSNVGLGTGFYKFDNQGVKTATEVISANSDTYRTKVHHQNTIYSCLKDLIMAICELENISFKTVTINPDDSIIEDTDKIRQQAMSEFNNKLISKVEYYKRVYKMSDEEALAFAQKVNEEIQQLTITDGSEFNIIE